eukprot:s4095_g3.t1
MGKARGCRTLIRTLRRTKCSVNRFCYDGSRLPGCCLHAGAMACWRLPFLERHRTTQSSSARARSCDIEFRCGSCAASNTSKCAVQSLRPQTRS